MNSNPIDKAIEFLLPGWALKRVQARRQLQRQRETFEQQIELHQGLTLDAEARRKAESLKYLSKHNIRF